MYPFAPYSGVDAGPAGMLLIKCALSERGRWSTEGLMDRHIESRRTAVSNIVLLAIKVCTNVLTRRSSDIETCLPTFTELTTLAVRTNCVNSTSIKWSHFDEPLPATCVEVWFEQESGLSGDRTANYTRPQMHIMTQADNSNCCDRNCVSNHYFVSQTR